MTDQQPVACSRCGRSLSTEDGQTVVGFSVNVSGSMSGPHEEAWHKAWQGIYPEVPLPINVALCYVCFLRPFGVLLPSSCTSQETTEYEDDD